MIDEDGNVYIGNQGGYVYSLSPSGSFNWRYLTGYELESSPALSQSNRVLIGCNDGNLYCIDRDGQFQWSYAGDGWVYRSSPAVGADGIIYCTAYYLRAWDDNGEFQWNALIGGPSVLSSASVSADGALYAGDGGGRLNKIYP
jgi:outer membrane protein assembly factor BamB